MLGGEPDLQMHVKNLTGSTPKLESPKLLILWRFSSRQSYAWYRKTGREFYPPSINARHDCGASGIRWCRIANVNGIIEIKSLVSLIATYSSYYYCCCSCYDTVFLIVLARDAFVRTNSSHYCHDVRLSVRPSICLSVCLGRACIVIIRYTLART